MGFRNREGCNSDEESQDQNGDRELSCLLLTGEDILSNEELLLEVASAYIHIFGSPPWNEGYYHKEKGRSVTISLQDYDKQCDCDHNFNRKEWEVFYTPEGVVDRIKSELDIENGAPFLGILEDEQTNEVGGFIWGLVSHNKDCANNVIMDGSFGDLVDSPERKLDKMWEEAGVSDEEAVFYIHEWAISPEFRGGVRPPVKTVVEAFDFGVQQGADNVFFVTSSNTNLYPLAKAFGGRVVMQTPTIDGEGNFVGIEIGNLKQITTALKMVRKLNLYPAVDYFLKLRLGGRN